MNSMSQKELWIKKSFFQLIKKGTKTLEARIGYPGIKRINEGSIILLLTGDKNQWETNKKNFPLENMLSLKVVAVRKYNDFNEALAKENVEKLLPGYTMKEAINLYNQLFAPEKIKQYGVIILEFQFI